MRLHPAILLVAAAPLFLAACTPQTSVASNTYPDVPNGFAEDLNLISAEPIAVWEHGGTILAVVTVGSGSCPPVPVSISAADDSTIALTFIKSPNSPCSADLGPTTHEFKIPAGIDVDGEVTVEILFDFDTDLNYSVVVEG